MKKKFSIYLIIVLLVVTGTLAATTSYLLKYMLEEPTHTYDYRWAKLHQRYPSLTPWLDSLKTTHQLPTNCVTQPSYSITTCGRTPSIFAVILPAGARQYASTDTKTTGWDSYTSHIYIIR